MNKNCVFTICSKNYLAQAITLKKSFIKHNSNVDFFLFLADASNEMVDQIGIENLDETWIPKWKEMAFKYDVIEFNTSIKPFCINKLFKTGYENVIYLDPDMYVVRNLNPIFEWLDKYSIVLTPHISYLQQQYSGAQPDGEILGVGLYNLGFGAFKNSEIGKKVVTWWMDRLEKFCYGEAPLFVDQKWMNFIPVFYPEDTLVTKHAGINTAIWNLHERTLIIEEDEYKVIDCLGDKYPLLFYHFSGFDPDVPKIINRRLANFNTDTYTSFKPIVEEYRKQVFENGYYTFHSMSYSFVAFDNGFQINGFIRNLFRRYIEVYPEYNGNPFNENDKFYILLKARKCLLEMRSNGKAIDTAHVKNSDRIQNKYIFPVLKLIKRLFGIKMIMKVRGLANRLYNRNLYNFLIDE